MVIDRNTGERIDGIIGSNFSSYVRDYDFSVVLPEHEEPQRRRANGFGDLHEAVSAFPELSLSG